jgi:uncharacterized membrane protein
MLGRGYYMGGLYNLGLATSLFPISTEETVALGFDVLIPGLHPLIIVGLIFFLCLVLFTVVATISELIPAKTKFKVPTSKLDHALNWFDKKVANGTYKYHIKTLIVSIISISVLFLVIGFLSWLFIIAPENLGVNQSKKDMGEWNKVFLDLKQCAKSTHNCKNVTNPYLYLIQVDKNNISKSYTGFIIVAGPSHTAFYTAEKGIIIRRNTEYDLDQFNPSANSFLKKQ